MCPIEVWAAEIKRQQEDFPCNKGKKMTVYSYKHKEFTSTQVTELLREVLFSIEWIKEVRVQSGRDRDLLDTIRSRDVARRRWKKFVIPHLIHPRPQVLELLGGMSADMAKTKIFTDLSQPTKKGNGPENSSSQATPNSVRPSNKFVPEVSKVLDLG